MNEVFRSILLGTAGLDLCAGVALVLSLSRMPRTSEPVTRHRLWRYALAGITVQVLHVAEEGYTGFHRRFPELLGLVSWPTSFFLVFNLAWIAIWLLSLAFLGSKPRMALFPLWFLAIAAVANGVAHPVFSLLTGGYFPGLWSAPFLGLQGVLLWRILMAFTRPKAV